MIEPTVPAEENTTPPAITQGSQQFEFPAEMESPEQPQETAEEHLAPLALDLFDALQPFHGLGAGDRAALESAIEQDRQEKKWRKKEIQQALHTDTDISLPALGGLMLGPEEVGLLAGSLAFRPDKLKDKDQEAINRLVQQKSVQTLAALLCLADRLDTSGSHSTRIERVEAVQGRIWLLVSGPHAAEDAKAADGATEMWDQAGGLPLLVREIQSGEQEISQLPLTPETRRAIGIKPGDTMAEAAKKVWLYQLSVMLDNEQGTRQGDDIEALHDMRVATRRMRAAFDVFEDAFKPKALKPHLKGLRAAGRALGKVRDLDVFMEKAQNYLKSLPAGHQNDLDPLLQDWEASRDQARTEMLAHLNSRDYEAFKWSFNAFLQDPQAGVQKTGEGVLTPNRVFETAPVLIYSRLAEVRAYGSILDNASIEQLHALRIEFKKLRYTVEYFREVLGDEARQVIDELKQIQDHLGDLNDAQVAVEIVRQFLEDWEVRQTDAGASEARDPAGVAAYLAARYAERHQLLVTFKDAWARFIRPELRRSLALAVSVL